MAGAGAGPSVLGAAASAPCELTAVGADGRAGVAVGRPHFIKAATAQLDVWSDDNRPSSSRESMPYWRMQLHPADPRSSMKHSVNSVAAGFIGLDFAEDAGDLRHVDRATLPPGQTDYWDFANRLAIGDRVLVIVHHFPFALVTVSGEYNYMRATEPELGVWFRHFRRIDVEATQFFADRVTNARAWDQYRMTDTIAPLLDPTGQSFRLIADWTGE